MPIRNSPRMVQYLWFITHIKTHAHIQYHCPVGPGACTTSEGRRPTTPTCAISRNIVLAMQITTVRASEYITLLVCHFLPVEQKLLNYPFETSKNFLEIEQEIRLH